CHWAKDIHGALLFLIELDGDHQKAFSQNLIKIRGVDIALRGLSASKQVIVLSLQKQVDADIFESFCTALIRALSKVKAPNIALEVVFAHLNRWKLFLAGNKTLMSPHRIRGLYAELTFLNELIDVYDDQVAIDSWLGPEMSQHDFSFYNIDIEIKALSGTERNSVEISSEDQLFSLNEKLYLRLYMLGKQPDTSVGISLNQLVNNINKKLSSTDVSDSYLQKLNEYGYYPDVEYDKSIFTVRKINSYIVEESFPRIIKHNLPDGISRVKYHINLEKIQEFTCDNNKIFESANA